MSRKGKRRRDVRRARRQRLAEDVPQGPAERQQAPPDSEPDRPAAVPTAAAATVAKSKAARKRRTRSGGLLGFRVSPWLIAAPAVAAAVGIVAVLILSSGSSGTTGSAAPTPTPDPRVAGLEIDISLPMEAGDDEANPAVSSFFEPNVLRAKAGEVIEIELTNTGSLSHNLWVTGPDNRYDSLEEPSEDDFGPINLITPGETGRLVVKIDEAGTYDFRCEIHPQVQTGTLVLS